jgi:hypothetical protein
MRATGGVGKGEVGGLEGAEGLRTVPSAPGERPHVTAIAAHTGWPRWRPSAATFTRVPRTNSCSRPGGRGTQTSPLQSPSGLATQPRGFLRLPRGEPQRVA